MTTFSLKAILKGKVISYFTPRKLLFFSFLLLTTGLCFSQESAPYSIYGLGDIISPVFSANRGMGYLAAPYASGININTANPASYASLVRTTVELGIALNGSGITSGDSVYHSGGAGVSHFALAFVPNPKHNNYAICIALQPYSNVNYNFIQAFNDSALGPYNQNYSGSGTTYNVMLGGAYKVKGFSIGANLGYIFGKLSYEKYISFVDSINAYNTRNITNMNVNGFSYSLGVQYELLIHKNNNSPYKNIFLFLGAYGQSSTKLTATISNYWDRYNYNSSGNLVVADTLVSDFNEKGKITMPYTLGGGVMFGNERFWLAGVDFKYTNWSVYSTPLDNGQLTNSWQAHFGLQITPNIENSRNYIDEIQYRAGAYYGTTNVTVGNTNLTQGGATFGLGFPLRTVAHLNFTGDFGTIGSGSSKSIIRENYYRFTIGFVLNDIWFVKRKFD